MQPDGSRTWASIEGEGDRALRGVAHVILRVGDVEDAGFRRAIFELEQHRAGGRGVLDLLAADARGVLGLDGFLFRRRLFFLFRFFRSCLVAAWAPEHGNPRHKLRKGSKARRIAFAWKR